MNAISKFNNLGQGRKIIAIGVIQTVGFLTSFLILVPYYGGLGVAYSILIAYTASAAYAISLFERAERRYIANSVVAVIIGYVSGYAINFMLDHSLPIIVSSIIATSVVLLALKNTSVSELRQLIRSINKPKANPIMKKEQVQVSIDIHKNFALSPENTLEEIYKIIAHSFRKLPS